MLPFILAVLIVYGFVLIVVRGSIFKIPRTAFFKLVAACEAWFAPTVEHVTELLIIDSNEIDKKYKDIYRRILLKAQIDPDKAQDLAPLIQELSGKIRDDIEHKRHKNILKKTTLCILQTVQKFWQCPMCLGFWIGIALSVLALHIPISIFGITLVLLSGFGSTTVISAFLLGCLFAGTTWAIDQFVEFFSEIKDRFVWRQ